MGVPRSTGGRASQGTEYRALDGMRLGFDDGLIKRTASQGRGQMTGSHKEIKIQRRQNDPFCRENEPRRREEEEEKAWRRGAAQGTRQEGGLLIRLA